MSRKHPTVPKPTSPQRPSPSTHIISSDPLTTSHPSWHPHPSSYHSTKLTTLTPQLCFSTNLLQTITHISFHLSKQIYTNIFIPQPALPKPPHQILCQPRFMYYTLLMHTKTISLWVPTPHYTPSYLHLHNKTISRFSTFDLCYIPLTHSWLHFKEG